jgi:molybdate transport system substrate-binding protein
MMSKAMQTLFGRVATMFALLLLLPVPASAQPAEPLTVFAAASLTDALQEVGTDFTRRTGLPVRFSFASSAVLARQLEAGAPAGIFISADRDWMDHVQSRGLIVRSSRVALLRGRLVLIAPVDSKVQLRIGRGFPLARALGGGRLAIGDPQAVPAGRYARAALTAYGVWPSVAARLAPAENVRAALLLVARKEAPLGIVYETDAKAEPRVRIVGTFPSGSHPPIVYPMAVTSKASPAAANFARYVQGSAAAVIFRRHGFIR